MDMYVPVTALRTLPVVQTMVTLFYADSITGHMCFFACRMVSPVLSFV